MRTFKTVFAAISLISLAGCQPTLMNIDVPEIEECPACECELPPVPPLIPETLKIDINQNKIDLDKGGQELLNNYIDTREDLQKLWQKRSF